MFDKLYENIGIKVKGLAKCVFVVETIVAIIAGVSLMATDEDLVFSGLLTFICGPIIAWVSSWVLYAIGEAAEDVRVPQNIEYSTSEGKNVGNLLCSDAEKKIEYTKNELSQESSSETLSMEKPVDYEPNASWEEGIKKLSSEKLYKRFCDIGNYSDTYRYMCYLELKNREK